MVLTALIFIGFIVLVSLATFRGNGDVARWAAISTMLLAMYAFILGFVFLALLVGMVYLLARLLHIAPHYTGRAQDVVQKLAARIQHISNMIAKPIISLDSFGASVKALLGRK